jgi:tRNA A-37 threonylcarbamoyl transferase component Bud32
MNGGIELREQRWGRYRALVNSAFESDVGREEIAQFFARPMNHDTGAGRGRVEIASLLSGRSVVIRRYRRGGGARLIWSDRYVRIPLLSLRPFGEARILLALLSHGVQVPSPVIAAVHFDLSRSTYQGYLATGLVPGGVNLLTLSRDTSVASANIPELCFRAGVEAWKMLRAGYYHYDLHLGNVLVSGENGVYLIDFDKARKVVTARNADQCVRALVRRWERYARKHRVQHLVVSPFREGLIRGALQER